MCRDGISFWQRILQLLCKPLQNEEEATRVPGILLSPVPVCVCVCKSDPAVSQQLSSKALSPFIARVIRIRPTVFLSNMENRYGLQLVFYSASVEFIPVGALLRLTDGRQYTQAQDLDKTQPAHAAQGMNEWMKQKVFVNECAISLKNQF